MPPCFFLLPDLSLFSFRSEEAITSNASRDLPEADPGKEKGPLCCGIIVHIITVLCVAAT